MLTSTNSNIQIWPVIHLLDPAQALKNAEIAFSAGVAGVFLIQMDGLDDMVDECGTLIRQKLPKLSLGANYLSMPALTALERSLSHGFDATWSDNPGVRSDGVSKETQSIQDLLLKNSNHLYFGSVAFKYQPKDLDPSEAAKRALGLGMIPTTSGQGTGLAPSAEKLRSMSETSFPRQPLAVASGITPENIQELGEHLSHVLVATGIGQDFYNFCPEKLQELIEKSRFAGVRNQFKIARARLT